MVRAITAAALFLLAPRAQAADRWTTTDTAVQLAFVSVVAADWAQTRTNVANGCATGWRETNPFLGRCPSPSKVDVMILGAVVGHTAAAYLLPRKWRSTWQSAWIVAELGAVGSNHLAGWRIRF